MRSQEEVDRLASDAADAVNKYWGSVMGERVIPSRGSGMQVAPNRQPLEISSAARRSEVVATAEAPDTSTSSYPRGASGWRGPFHRGKKWGGRGGTIYAAARTGPDQYHPNYNTASRAAFRGPRAGGNYTAARGGFRNNSSFGSNARPQFGSSPPQASSSQTTIQGGPERYEPIYNSNTAQLSSSRPEVESTGYMEAQGDSGHYVPFNSNAIAQGDGNRSQAGHYAAIQDDHGQYAPLNNNTATQGSGHWPQDAGTGYMDAEGGYGHQVPFNNNTTAQGDGNWSQVNHNVSTRDDHRQLAPINSNMTTRNGGKLSQVNHNVSAQDEHRQLAPINSGMTTHNGGNWVEANSSAPIQWGPRRTKPLPIAPWLEPSPTQVDQVDFNWGPVFARAPFDAAMAADRSNPFEPIMAEDRFNPFEPIVAADRPSPFDPIMAEDHASILDAALTIGRRDPFQPPRVSRPSFVLPRRAHFPTPGNPPVPGSGPGPYAPAAAAGRTEPTGGPWASVAEEAWVPSELCDLCGDQPRDEVMPVSLCRHHGIEMAHGDFLVSAERRALTRLDGRRVELGMDSSDHCAFDLARRLKFADFAADVRRRLEFIEFLADSTPLSPITREDSLAQAKRVGIIGQGYAPATLARKAAEEKGSSRDYPSASE